MNFLIKIIITIIIIEGSKSRVGDITPNISRSYNNEVVEWSEQLRSVTSVWLGAAAAAFKSDSAPAGV